MDIQTGLFEYTFQTYFPLRKWTEKMPILGNHLTHLFFLQTAVMVKLKSGQLKLVVTRFILSFWVLWQWPLVQSMDNTMSDNPLPISQAISIVKGYIWNLMCCTKQRNSYQKETVHNDAPNQKFRLKKKKEFLEMNSSLSFSFSFFHFY